MKEKFKLSHTLPIGKEKLVSMIPHSESTVDEEVEFTTSTQYVISGSTLDISRVKGAVQVREMLVSTRSTDRAPTASSRPASVLITDDRYLTVNHLKIITVNMHYDMSAVFLRFCTN